MRKFNSDVAPKLLSNMRKVLEEHGNDEHRLQKIVSIVRKNLNVSVCSIYVVQPQFKMELFATDGLRQEAIHRTTLKIGDGLVGKVAKDMRELNVADAAHHPAFVFKPETGEEQLESFLGIPIFRKGILFGVFTIQDKVKEEYSPAFVELVKNLAMILAEFLSASNLLDLSQQVSNVYIPKLYYGKCVNAGIGMGNVCTLKSEIDIQHMISDDIEFEHNHLKEALQQMQDNLESLMNKEEVVGNQVSKDVFQTFLSISKDISWIRRLHHYIDQGFTAAAAVKKATDFVVNVFRTSDDKYMQERAYDFEDLGERLIHILDPSIELDTSHLDNDIILISHNIGVTRLLDFDLKRIKGIVLGEAAKHSHAIIVAKSLGIPILQLTNSALEAVENAEFTCLDTKRGILIQNPDAEVKEQFAAAINLEQKSKVNLVSLQDLPAVTKDGTDISLQVNVGLRYDMDNFDKISPNGVGLFRTEIPFLVNPNIPSVQYQTSIYKEIIEIAGNKPVTFRTLDIGGDKYLSWRKQPDEDNPAMGWRATRMSKDVPSLLRRQLRALIRAAEGKSLNIMFPLITEMNEWHYCKDMFLKEISYNKDSGFITPVDYKIGIMFEVPALFWQLDEIMENVDFISIGSNDLGQFLFAADRSSSLVGQRYDILSPVMLKFYRQVLKKAVSHKVPVTICGEAATDTLSLLGLMAIGFKNFSVQPLAISSMRDTIRETNLLKLKHWFNKLIDNNKQKSLRSYLQNWARDNDINLS